MFFRRVTPKEPTFEDRLDALRRAAFEIASQTDGRALVSKNGCAAMVAHPSGEKIRIERAGWLLGGELAQLVDGGYQKFWRADSGRKAPALAGQLQNLHGFEEDLREALGLVSLYNTSLGTTNDLHLYDRVEGRDSGTATHPWQGSRRSG